MFDEKYTEEYLNTLLEATLEVAPAIYYTRGHNFWHGESVEDFVQESLLHIFKLFETRYILPLDESKGTAKNLVSSLLSGTFLFNRANLVYRDKYNENIRVGLLEDSEDRRGWKVPKRMLESRDPTADELVNRTAGKQLLHDIVERTLSKKAVKTRVYNYQGHSKEFKDFELTEYNIMQHILLGYSMQDIVELFGLDNSREKIGQANVVRRIINRTVKKVADKMDKLDSYEIDLVREYVNNI